MLNAFKHVPAPYTRNRANSQTKLNETPLPVPHITGKAGFCEHDIVADAELRTLLARILELCKARLRYMYELPCEETINTKLSI